MSETQLMIGAEVRCSDGPGGHLRRVIVDPADNRLTHLAVRPDGLQSGRLVPADQVVSADGGVLLRCSTAEFARFEADEVVPESGPGVPRGPGQPVAPGVTGIEQDTGYGNQMPTRERIPAGGVQVRHGEPVYAAEREVGQTQGVGVDLEDRYVTHLLLDSGHFWGRKRVAVPSGHVAYVGDVIQLDLTKDEVRDLPSLEVEGGMPGDEPPG